MAIIMSNDNHDNQTDNCINDDYNMILGDGCFSDCNNDGLDHSNDQ